MIFLQISPIQQAIYPHPGRNKGFTLREQYKRELTQLLYQHPFDSNIQMELYKILDFLLGLPNGSLAQSVGNAYPFRSVTGRGIRVTPAGK